MYNFTEWTLIRALDTDLQNRHFDVIIREIKLWSIEMKNDLCFCGSGKKASECHSEIADNTAMSYLFEAFKMIDEDIKNAVPAPQCKRNCNECCKYSFDVSAAEYFAILRYMQKKFTGFSACMIKKTAFKMFREFPAIGDTENNIGVKFAPCIFLDNRRGKCRIYEVRPLICRMYGYFTPAGYCQNVNNGIKIVTDNVNDHVSKFLGDTLTEENIFKPPIAVPLVYWFGSNVLKNADVKELFITAHEKSVNEYVKFSITGDFNEWF